MIRQLFTVSTMIMALGMTPTQAYGGTRIQETNQSKNGQCTGTIIDPTGEPVIGATVTVKGKQGGTITDLDECNHAGRQQDPERGRCCLFRYSEEGKPHWCRFYR